MSFRWVLLLFISVLSGVLLFFVFRFFTYNEPRPLVARYGDIFTILVVDEFEDDKKISEALNLGGIKGVISESTQYVPIDNFGTIRMVPLISFRNEIEYFDPRDDGYAARLRSFFVHNGRRFFFIPLEGNTPYLRSKITTILGGIPFSLIVFGQERVFFWYFILITIACLISLVFSKSKRHYIFLFPVLISVAWGAIPGIILAAILTGILELLREPVKEIFSSSLYRVSRADYAGKGFRGFLKKLKPFRLNVVLFVIFLVSLPALSIFAYLSPILLVASCALFFLLFFLSYKLDTHRFFENQHIPFTPVYLQPLKVKTFFLSPLLIPFGLVSILAIFIPSHDPRAQEKPLYLDSSFFISSEEYYQHLAFQQFFSFRPLGRQGDDQRPLNHESFFIYYLGEDGLIAGSKSYEFSVKTEGLSFPLEKLMDFLVRYYKPMEELTDNNVPFNPAPMPGDWILTVAILTFCLMDLLRPKTAPQKSQLWPRDKRITV